MFDTNRAHLSPSTDSMYCFWMSETARFFTGHPFLMDSSMHTFLSMVVEVAMRNQALILNSFTDKVTRDESSVTSKTPAV